MYMALEAGDTATWVGSVVAVVVAALSWFQGHQDRKKQEQERIAQQDQQQLEARMSAEAAEASHRQAEAAERRALAVEQMIERIMTPAAPPVSAPSATSTAAAVKWHLERRGKHAFVLRNVGSATATKVRVDPTNLPYIARNLPENSVARPNEGIEFLMAGTMGMPVPSEIWVTWEGHGEAQAVAVPGM